MPIAHVPTSVRIILFAHDHGMLSQSMVVNGPEDELLLRYLPFSCQYFVAFPLLLHPDYWKILEFSSTATFPEI